MLGQSIIHKKINKIWSLHHLNTHIHAQSTDRVAGRLYTDVKGKYTLEENVSKYIWSESRTKFLKQGTKSAQHERKYLYI